MSAPHPIAEPSSESPFVAGLEVVVIRNYRFGAGLTYTRGRIAKVHKGGNFRLEGSEQQYRPRLSGFGTGTGWSAYLTGDQKYAAWWVSIDIMTPAFEQKIAACARSVEYQDLATTIERHSRLRELEVTQAQLDAARALVAALESTEKPA